MPNSAEHVVRSPHCPNCDRMCNSCAWGFVTPEGVGQGELLASVPNAIPFQPMTSYRSDCGTVQLFQDQAGRIGAIRDDRFFPGIEGNFAFERFKGLIQIKGEHR